MGRTVHTSSSTQRISSFQVNQSSYGSPIKLIYGTSMISGVLMDYQDFTAIAHTETTSSGGKGGKVKSSSTTYTYTVAGAIAIGEGTCTGIGKIWADSKTTDVGSLGLTFFNGDKGQKPWGYMLTKHPEHALTYSGTSYVAGVVDLGESASMPNYNFEVFGKCQSADAKPSTHKMLQYAYEKEIVISNFYANEKVEEYIFDPLTSTGSWQTLDSRYYTVERTKDSSTWHDVGDESYTYTFNFDDRTDGYDRVDPTYIRIYYRAYEPSVLYPETDANPRDVIYDVLSSTVYGENFPTVLIDDLSMYGSYCEKNSLLLSPVYDSSTAATDIINGLCEATNSDYVFSQGKAKIIPYYDGLTPIYNLTDADIINQGEDTIDIERTSQADTYNIVPLEHLDRANEYNTNIVYAVDEGDIELHGVRQASTYTHHEIMRPAIAQAVAQVILQKQLYNRNTYTVRLGQEYVLLEPMDAVTIASKLAGLDETAVRVVEIKENADDMTLDITFEDNLSGTTSAPKYDTQDTTRATTNVNTKPGDANPPVIFEAPVELVESATGHEAWIYASGGKWWGGADVWVSDDGDTYKQIGRIENPAIQGVTTNDLPYSDSPDTKNILSVDLAESRGTLSSGTQSDAENLNTLVYVNGEFMAYQTATLTGTNKYDLSYLVRGAFGSDVSVHSPNEDFVRVNGSCFKYPFTANDIGKTVWIKLTSYNVYGTEEQELSDVPAYKFTLTGKLTEQIPPAPYDVSYETTYRHYEDGSTGYDITLTFKVPKGENITNGLVYYKANNVAANLLGVIPEGSTGEELGFNTDWKFAGADSSTVTIPAAQLGDTYKIKLVTQTKYGTVTPDDKSYMLTVNVLGKTEVPNTPQGLIYSFTRAEGFKFTWDIVTNTDISYYELRLDSNFGNATNLLGRSKSNTLTVNLTHRKATVYLYAVNTMGKGSRPAIVKYDVPAPNAPTFIDVKQAPLALTIAVPRLIDGADGMNLHISGKNFTTTVDIGAATTYTFSHDADIYTITAAYYDVFGEGNLSQEFYETIEPYFDPAWIEDGSVSLAKVDDTVKAAVKDAQDAIPRLDGIDTTLVGIDTTITGLKQTDTELSNTIVENKKTQDGQNSTFASQIKQNADNVTSIVENLNNEDPSSSAYKSITKLQQTADSISSTVKKNKSATDMAISKVDQKADSISSTVQKNKSATDTAISKVDQKADSISSTVQDYKTSNDKTVSGLSSKVTQNANSITSIVTNLGKSPSESGYSAITQLQDAVNLRVQKGDVINQINLTSDGTTIDGKYLHVTGDTKFDNNVIVENMIKAGAVSSEKMSVDKLSAISAKLGDVTAGTIKGSTFQNDDKSFYIDSQGNINGSKIKGSTISGSTFQNEDGTFSIDKDGNIKGANITGSSLHLTSSDLELAGLKLKAIDFVKGSFQGSGDISLPSGYSLDQCFIIISTRPTISQITRTSGHYIAYYSFSHASYTLSGTKVTLSGVWVYDHQDATTSGGPNTGAFPSTISSTNGIYVDYGVIGVSSFS